MIDCAKARELSGSYIDGELDEAACLAYEDHISCCESCREEYDMLRKLSADLSAIASPLPEGFAKRVHTALVNEQFNMHNEKEKKGRGFAFPFYRAGTLVAAALIIVVIGKYGVYDTYKKVTEDTARTATMLQEKENHEFGDDAGAVEPNSADKPVEYKSAEKESGVYNPTAYVHTTASLDAANAEAPAENNGGIAAIAEEAEAEAAAANEPAAADVPLSEDTPAGDFTAMMSLEKAVDAAVTETDESTDTSQPAPAQARMAEPTAEEALADEPAAYDTEEAGEEVHAPAAISGGSGGGSSSAAATELVPAVVTIHNSGDGSMIMFKKFLLTFLDSSEISESNGEITITIPAGEYAGVMQHLRSNEYVKSVTEGTPSGGRAVIAIR